MVGRRVPSFTQAYNGYTSCPIPVSHDKLMLAEFGYDGVPMQTFQAFGIDQRVPNAAFFQLKRFMKYAVWRFVRLRGAEQGVLAHCCSRCSPGLCTLTPCARVCGTVPRCCRGLSTTRRFENKRTNAFLCPGLQQQCIPCQIASVCIHF